MHMSLQKLSFVLPFGFVALFGFGCSSDPGSDPPVIIQSGNDMGNDSTSDTTTDTSTEDVPLRDNFTLTLNITTLSDTDGNLPIVLALRKVSTGEQLIFETADFDRGELRQERVDFLERGESYELGISSRYNGCARTDPGWNRAVTFIEINDVEDDISIQKQLTQGEENDYRGCDVIHVPISVPPGQYSANRIDGRSGNEITFTVSQTGRLYQRRVFVLCDDAGQNNCLPSLLTGTSAGCADVTPLPGETVVEIRGGDQDGRTNLDGELTVDNDAGTLHVVGQTETKASVFSDEPCCSLQFDFLLPRVGSNDDCI